MRTLLLCLLLVNTADAQGVYLFRGSDGQGYSNFSGVCVGRVGDASVILTCGHCVPPAIQTVELDYRGGWQPVTIRTRQQPGPDLALLESDLPLDYFPLAELPPVEGTAVYGWGHRSGGPLNKFSATISGTNTDGSINLSRTIRPGDSGGAVLSGRELVGILSASPADKINGQFVFREDGEAVAQSWLACRELLVETYGGVPGHTQQPPQEQPLAGKPTVLVFTADWCGPCQDFWRAMNRPIGGFGEQVKALANIVAVPEGDPRQKQYNVTAVPTFVLASDPTQRFSGYDRCTLTRLQRLVASAPAPRPEPKPLPAPIPQQPEPSPFEPGPPPVDLTPLTAEVEKLRAELEKARQRLEVLEQEPIRLTIKYNDGTSFSQSYPHGTPIVLDFTTPEKQPATPPQP
jgi:thiol-disulfide isomerase/thioredoxin